MVSYRTFIHLNIFTIRFCRVRIGTFNLPCATPFALPPFPNLSTLLVARGGAVQRLPSVSPLVRFLAWRDTPAPAGALWDLPAAAVRSAPADVHS